MRPRLETLPVPSDYRPPFSVVMLRCGAVACLWIFVFWIVASLGDLLPPLGSVLAIVLVIGLGAIVQFGLAEILNQVARRAYYAQAGHGPTGKPSLPT